MKARPLFRVSSLGCEFRLRGSSAFTLVEVLVVISIMVVMIAILLPSLKNARKRAVEAKEISLMRQMGIASSNYVAENRLRLVLYQDDGAKTYPAKIAPYMNIKVSDPIKLDKAARKLMVCTDDLSPNVAVGNGISLYWQVPVKKSVPDPQGLLFVNYSNPPTKPDYRYAPYHIKTKYSDDWVMCGKTWPTQDRIEQPSRQVLTRCPDMYVSPDSDDSPKYSHNSMRGVIYFDNHGERRYIANYN